jgi:hypothetical protein
MINISLWMIARGFSQITVMFYIRAAAVTEYIIRKRELPIIVVTPHRSKYVKSGYVKLIIKRLKLEENDGN